MCLWYSHYLCLERWVEGSHQNAFFFFLRKWLEIMRHEKIPARISSPCAPCTPQIAPGHTTNKGVEPPCAGLDGPPWFSVVAQQGPSKCHSHNHAGKNGFPVFFLLSQSSLPDWVMVLSCLAIANVLSMSKIQHMPLPQPELLLSYNGLYISWFHPIHSQKNY